MFEETEKSVREEWNYVEGDEINRALDELSSQKKTVAFKKVAKQTAKKAGPKTVKKVTPKTEKKTAAPKKTV